MSAVDAVTAQRKLTALLVGSRRQSDGVGAERASGTISGVGFPSAGSVM
jgi:hypothetical protein